MLKFLFGDPNARVVRSLQPIIEKINALEPTFERLDAAELSLVTAKLRERLTAGETLDAVLPDAFAAVREAARRQLGQRHYDVQLVGGIVLHHGQIAEMRTGEGKTLTATLAVYLNALAGKGVHVVTVNDYLARRDAAWMGRVYAALGVTVSCLNHEQAYQYDVAHLSAPKAEDQAVVAVENFRVAYDFLRPVSRQEAYACDITYGTNNEYGFDYLRDNMVMRREDMVQRGHPYAIVDEVDSILIDEARTPLIISAPAEGADAEYRRFAELVRKLEVTTHYVLDEKLRAVTLTEEGIARVEALLGVANVYGEGTRLVHHLEQALRAQTLYHRDREYVVREGEVIIVDEFTGRLMQGRRYSEGLHQAIEAKEGVAVQRESETLATITFQNYFRLYAKLAGMTGTAATEAEEFSKIYKLEVVTIPTHRPMVRVDATDRVYRTEAAKRDAVVAEIRERHERGQPVLIGTISIEKNEELHALLERASIPHQVLNAKQHEREGETIAQAGRRGAVTVATNMAGRGVDIILGGNPPDAAEHAVVQQLGGLHVIGTERHESRRIDNQLRGRSGRQGDPGSSQFFVSLADDLMRIFGGERLQSVMARLGVPDDVPIENRVVMRQIAAAQEKVEHHHFDTRKHLLDYDDVLNKHREVVYRKRVEVLGASDCRVLIHEMIENEAERLVAARTPGEASAHWELDELAREAAVMMQLPEEAATTWRAPVSKDGKHGAAERRTVIVASLAHAAVASLVALEERVGSPDGFQFLCRATILRAMDQLWIEHLDTIEHLRHGIGLRGYGQRDPLIEYKREAFRLFTNLLALIQHDVVLALTHAAPVMEAQSVFARRDMQLSGAAKEMERGRQLLGGAPPSDAPPTTSVPKWLAGAIPVAESLTSEVSGTPEAGRNDPCPCGDGRKYKKCHGA